MAAQPAPLLELRAITKRFTSRLDLASRIAAKLGANLRERTVHAVDRVSLAVQMIFQDPFASLNARLRIAAIVGEAPVVHGLIAARDQEAYVADLLALVGLDATLARRFPHQFSGGQRSRIGIARALAVKPRFLVCDEAVAALDVSIQAQVLNLFMRLREEFRLTYLFISHDLGVVRHLSDRVAIIYLGRLVESAASSDVFARPNYPYTQALIAEVPSLEPKRRAYVPVKGEIPSPLNPPTGCHFHPRFRTPWRAAPPKPRCCAQSRRAIIPPATSTTGHERPSRLHA